MLPTAEVAAGTYVDPDAEKNRGEYAGDLRRENMKLHCYVCKKYGHTKKDCPNKRCRFCFEIGHEREDCPVSGAPPTPLAQLQAAMAAASLNYLVCVAQPWAASLNPLGCVAPKSSALREHDRCEQEWKKELERLKVEDKKRKRKQQYEKKKFTRYQERSRALRDATGVHGFVRGAPLLPCFARPRLRCLRVCCVVGAQAALYRVLGLNDRKLVRPYPPHLCPLEGSH